MKKLLLLPLLFVLGGCAQQLATAKTIYDVATETVVPASAVIAAANTFDLLEAAGTVYLRFCKTNLADSRCAADYRRTVIKYARSGRQARNQLETSLQTSAPAPATIYNVLIAAVNGLTASPAPAFGGAK